MSSPAPCKVCNRTAYPLESYTLDGSTYHKLCFKCQECGVTCSMKNFAMIHGNIFCKPHFKQLFSEKGNYDVFGQNPNHKTWKKVNYSPGMSIDSTVVDEPVAPATRERSNTTPVSAPAPAPAAPAASTERRGSVLARACVVAGCANQRVPRQMYCQDHLHDLEEKSPAPAAANPSANPLIQLTLSRDVAAVREHITQNGVSCLFVVDPTKRKTPIEVAFSENAPAVGSAMLEAIQAHIASLEARVNPPAETAQ
eukprot:TRINITY_DN238_c0_g1_i5.p1 TRINITY_DN238_c0_g1~~TRINITY_DN238_c0_g1_i5.p1  ORF type:complete len:254 (+),score=106.05 TRINITY_DN238_c0_g1_i5:108-869(+)